MTPRFSALAVAALLALAAAPADAAAKKPPPPPAPPADPALAIPAVVKMPAYNGATIAVTSPAFKAGGDMPFEATQYRGNIFPGLAWAKSLPGTQSYVVILQDTDVIRPTGPLVHWTMYNIPPNVTKLEAAMLVPPAGSAYGPNFKGAAQSYLGPHTPPGPKHHYHFQVFALDTKVADPGASYEALVASMRGHVLANGEIVARAQFDANPPPPAPPPGTLPMPGMPMAGMPMPGAVPPASAPAMAARPAVVAPKPAVPATAPKK